MKKRLIVLLIITISFISITSSNASLKRSEDVKKIICIVFKEHCKDALRVAHCESRFDVNAVNGQYENIFQMGYNERKTYGWHTRGSSAWKASRAAYRYFERSGKDWSPWECKP